MGPVVIAIAVLVTLIIAVPVTAVVAISYRKKVVEAKIGNADEKARQIVDDALPRMSWKGKQRNVEQSCSVTKNVYCPKKKQWTKKRTQSKEERQA